MDWARFESAKEYIGFSRRTSEELRRLYVLVEPHFGPIVDDFYAAIDAHPEARQVITGGAAQTERLKATLVKWLESVFQGPHDEAYLAAHARIGRAHVRIGLQQDFMFTAMNRIRSRLIELLAELGRASRLEFVTSALAVNQALDLELSIMLGTYLEDLDIKRRTAERLATIGQVAANIGHELRNPLSTIQSSLYLISQRYAALELEDATIEKHHRRICRQVELCNKTISNLLDLARERRPHRQRVAVEPLVEESIQYADLDNGVSVELELAPNLDMFVDPDAMRLVLGNLLLNAAEAMTHRGRVRISATAGSDGVELRVSDEGPGVAEQDRARVFDALFTTKPHGTGLGLALCRRIVEAHGGEIGIAPVERGACFRIWIPCPPSQDDR